MFFKFNLTAVTQNCEGISGEISKKHGPKIGAIKRLLPSNVDFLALTETKCKPNALRHQRISKDLHLSIFSLNTNAKAGVMLWVKNTHKLIKNSVRTSTIPGHFALGVYLINKHKIIVGGYYGCSESNDAKSCDILNEFRTQIIELKHIYNCQDILLLGDFNVTRTAKDSQNSTIKKRQTSLLLNNMIDEFYLTDVGLKKAFNNHTWFRRGSDKHSSRIDYILTNLAAKEIKFNMQFSMFDHSMLSCTVKNETLQTTATMKDFIVSSDEFIQYSVEQISNLYDTIYIPLHIFDSVPNEFASHDEPNDAEIMLSHVNPPPPQPPLPYPQQTPLNVQRWMTLYLNCVKIIQLRYMNLISLF